MGFDKPDLSFVIHYQFPGSAISYYQQVGRAGRGARGVVGHLAIQQRSHRDPGLLHPHSIPTRLISLNVLSPYLKNGLEPISKRRPTRIVQRPFEPAGDRFSRTWRWMGRSSVRAAAGSELFGIGPSTTSGSESVTATAEELSNSRCSPTSAPINVACSCSSSYLDDTSAEPCGICDNCTGRRPCHPKFDPATVQHAVRSTYAKPDQTMEIEPRIQPPGRRTHPRRSNGTNRGGYAVGMWGDGGWGSLAQEGKQVQGQFDEQLVRRRHGSDRRLSWKPEPSADLGHLRAIAAESGAGGGLRRAGSRQHSGSRVKMSS